MTTRKAIVANRRFKVGINKYHNYFCEPNEELDLNKFLLGVKSKMMNEARATARSRLAGERGILDLNAVPDEDVAKAAEIPESVIRKQAEKELAFYIDDKEGNASLRIDYVDSDPDVNVSDFVSNSMSRTKSKETTKETVSA